ncbi:hypothetical protein HAX54_006709, partial [Datura stramonium]|nr:hypothetical protein [Datura stramonium]
IASFDDNNSYKGTVSLMPQLGHQFEPGGKLFIGYQPKVLYGRWLVREESAVATGA